MFSIHSKALKTGKAKIIKRIKTGMSKALLKVRYKNVLQN